MGTRGRRAVKIRSEMARCPAAVLVSFFAASALLTSGCVTDASWSRARAEVIDPIHELLHHTYPETLQSMDRAALAALFATDGRREAMRESLALLDGFREIEHAAGFIERVELDESPVRGLLRLRVDGVGPDGRLRSIRQEKELLLVKEGGGWRISADRPLQFSEAPPPPVWFADEALARGLWFQHEGKPKLDLEVVNQTTGDLNTAPARGSNQALELHLVNSGNGDAELAEVHHGWLPESSVHRPGEKQRCPRRP